VELPITSATRLSANAGWLKNHIDQIAKANAEKRRIIQDPENWILTQIA
jgi:hypothetical protein